MWSWNGVSFCAESFGKHNCKMANPTQADNTNLFAWTSAVVDEWTEGRQAGAEHWGGLVRRKFIWDRKDPEILSVGKRARDS
jgi:hypothetical protein